MKNAKKIMALGLAAVLLMGTIACSSDGGAMTMSSLTEL